MTADDGGSRGRHISRRRALAIGGAAALSLASTSRLPSASTGSDPDEANASENGGREGDADALGRIHRAGITGEGVDVAVLDPTGFDPTHDAVAGGIREIRQFGSRSAVAERTTHGTGAAAAVAELAPDARLSLASFDTPAEFVAAVEWCRERETDVLLAPVAAHGSVATGRSDVARAAGRAVDAGCVLVAPTGNAALGHWEGPAAALLGDGETDPRRLRIRPLPGADSVRGRFRAWLVVDASVESDLTLALLRAVDGGRRWNLLAVSRAVDSRAGQRLTADLDDGTHALVVRADGAEADRRPDANASRIEIATPTHALSSARPLGSVAVPASVPGVVGVGVTDAARTEAESADSAAAPVAPYSGRGPVAGGDLGVDVVAPPRPWIADGRPGTSAAAARVAGVAALLRAADPELEPSAVTRTLRASAADVGRAGPDVVSGHGRLAPLAAVQRVRAR